MNAYRPTVSPIKVVEMIAANEGKQVEVDGWIFIMVPPLPCGGSEVPIAICMIDERLELWPSGDNDGPVTEECTWVE